MRQAGKTRKPTLAAAAAAPPAAPSKRTRAASAPTLAHAEPAPVPRRAPTREPSAKQAAAPAAPSTREPSAKRLAAAPSEELQQLAADGVQLLHKGEELISYIPRARVTMPKSTREYVNNCERFAELALARHSRFWHKVLFDAGVVSTPEPFKKLVHQGIVLGEDNQKMSKSRGNVVNPDDMIDQFGADAVRLYEMFMGPLESMKPWSTRGVEGITRFLDRVWRLMVAEDGTLSVAVTGAAPTPEQQRLLHYTIKKVTDDIEALRFNTAISQMMVFTNEMTKLDQRPRGLLEPFVLLLLPFAPHLSEELWETADDGKALVVHRFQPDPDVRARAIVHIAHGMAEHGARYARAAEALTRRGYIVHADDHRGHGKTAASPDELGFIAEHGGFHRVVEDLSRLIAHAKQQHPGLPVVLLGHSMGSFYTQRFLIEHGHEIAGAVLSGTSGKPTPIATAGRLVARIERARLGPRGRSALLNKLSFDAFNKPFRPNRTAFDWLSRDPAEVDKYIADTAVRLHLHHLLMGRPARRPRRDRRPEAPAADPQAEIPIYVIAGAEDPVGARTKSIDQLLRAYRSAGLQNVQHRYYPGARHEILNETTRVEVVTDLVAWLDRHITA